LETDARSTLYLEYLQVLADVEPLAFVMENVRGLLSARMNGELVFSHIRRDLQNPRGELRHVRGGARYRLMPLVAGSPAVADTGQYGLLGEEFPASDFLVRAEEHGVPQSRQRVIVVGVREDVLSWRRGDRLLVPEQSPRTVRDAIQDLPELRSGVSGGNGADSDWTAVLRQAPKELWFKSVSTPVRSRMKDAIAEAAASELGRGTEFLSDARSTTGVPGVINHQTRGHMPADLHRYLFAASWAEVEGYSPTLKEFPKGLLPEHANVDKALSSGMFADRFRVQSWDSPSTTVVSHISKDGHYYIHPDPAQCRSLTVREAARLQTFPDDYFFCGPRTAQFHQVGNAVPVELARRIAGAVHRLIGG